MSDLLKKISREKRLFKIHTSLIIGSYLNLNNDFFSQFYEYMHNRWKTSKCLSQTVIWQIIVCILWWKEKSRGCKTELHFKLSILFEAIFYHEPKRTETISCIYVLLTCWSNHMHNKSKTLTIYVKLLRWNLCCQTCATQWVEILSERTYIIIFM